MYLHFSFQKSFLIILIMITCYHDNSLIGPIAHLSLSLFLSFTSCLSVFLLLLFIFFVMTPPHPNATAITVFNVTLLSSEYTVFLLLPNFLKLFFLSFCLSSFDSFFHRIPSVASPASTVTASGREPL